MSSDSNEFIGMLEKWLADAPHGAFAVLVVARPETETDQSTVYRMEVASISMRGADAACRSYCEQLQLLAVPEGEG